MFRQYLLCILLGPCSICTQDAMLTTKSYSLCAHGDRTIYQSQLDGFAECRKGTDRTELLMAVKDGLLQDYTYSYIAAN